MTIDTSHRSRRASAVIAMPNVIFTSTLGRCVDRFKRWFSWF
jgi:hypothetical protein